MAEAVPPFALVIFDCDGVLVDSEPIANAVFSAMLAELGLAVSDDDMVAHFVGRTTGHCVEIVEGMLGSPLPPGFTDDYQCRTQLALQSGLRAIPGVEAALDAIRLPCCVASNGERDKMRMTLGLTGLLPRFEGRMYSADDVTHGKPAPDLFLHAARHCGVAPSACVVIEDSPSGVIAGIAAGMTVYGYAGLVPAARLQQAGAHQVFNDMRRLPALLEPASVATVAGR
jgi:HAD superfamily hydrolase (TIGR01509 family)